MNLVDIAKAWITAANPTDEEREKANLRLEACNNCELLAYNERLKFHYCSECGCPTKGKIFDQNINACPLKKWDWEK